MKHASPAAFNALQTSCACAGDDAAARSRIPPEKGTIILFKPATEEKRLDSAVHARSAWARFANAPSWITLPEAPDGAGFGGSGFGAGAAAGWSGVFGSDGLKPLGARR